MFTLIQEKEFSRSQFKCNSVRIYKWHHHFIIQLKHLNSNFTHKSQRIPCAGDALLSGQRARQTEEANELKDERKDKKPRVSSKVWIGDEQTPQNDQDNRVENVPNIPQSKKHRKATKPDKTNIK